VQRFSLPSQPNEIEEAEGVTARRRILLVEDNPADVVLVREALEEQSVVCEVIRLSDGEQAVEFVKYLELDIQTLCPDLVILDLNLPRKPGRQVLGSIRESQRCKHTPVVVLTSSDDQKDRADAIRLGASLYLRKPSTLAEFLELGYALRSCLKVDKDPQ
jgi:CheY-like chemotaxis protein